MSGWKKPLHREELRFSEGLEWLLSEQWFPNDGIIMTSKNGSMEKRLIAFVIEHINSFVPLWVSKDKHYLLTLDGQSSREVWEWLSLCKTVKCCVVQAPSSTSHFLQPCDQVLNKRFKEGMRKGRDELLKGSLQDTRTVRVNVMVDMMGYSNISPSDIMESFKITGLGQMNLGFVDKVWRSKGHKHELEVQNRFRKNSVTGSLPPVIRRQSDTASYGKILDIVRREPSAAKAIQLITIVLKQNETVNSIIMEAGQPSRKPVYSRCCGGYSESNGDKSVALQSGTPAVYLTMGDTIEKRKKKEAEEEWEKRGNSKDAWHGNWLVEDSRRIGKGKPLKSGQLS